MPEWEGETGSDAIGVSSSIRVGDRLSLLALFFGSQDPSSDELQACTNTYQRMDYSATY